ncbi:MAG TPA: ABC transporter permease [Anaerohalosphaeraceae bacterium]|jgi:peptide/nickel transport system permease protein|nr:ABC transporter permease [Anaerohalosphaeraceae bacterium]HRT50116.1 ABC transporter permease [Anaerohalosphaeraceae bacterium]HRT86050.1 ABC transporter permease [Anaerohalosphaeraceae bacterium]
MLAYVLRRVLLAVPTLFGITLVTFFIINLAPGDPAQLQTQGIMDSKVSNRVYEELRQYYGLDQPIIKRYGQWLWRLVRLDFGASMSTDRRPVWHKIRERLWPTMSLAILSLGISLAVAIPIGIYSAARQDSLFDTAGSTILYALYSVPSYVMAVPLILIVAIQWNLLPFQGIRSDDFEQLSALGKIVDLVRHYTLITFCFSYGALAYYARFVRQNMLEVLRQDYIRTARAKGLRERDVIMRHGFRNALIPVMTLFGLLLPSIIGGSVILEVMFNWPGMGRLFFESMMSRDYPTIMALTFITACLVLLGTLLADLSYPFVDPRIAYD